MPRSCDVYMEMLCSSVTEYCGSPDECSTLLVLQQGDIAAMKNDYDQRLDNLTAQLLASEDVLGSKDNQIQSLHQRVKDYDGLKKQLTQQQQEIEALQAQVCAPALSLS